MRIYPRLTSQRASMTCEFDVQVFAYNLIGWRTLRGYWLVSVGNFDKLQLAASSKTLTLHHL